MTDQDSKLLSQRRFRGRPFLFTDEDGRIRFYDNGPRSYGYLVPNPACERSLRDAIERFQIVDKVFALVMLVPTVSSIFALGNHYSDRMFAILSLSIAIFLIGRILERNWFFGELVAGLDRLEPLDQVERRNGNYFLAVLGLVYISFVLWRILSGIAIQ